MEKRIFKKINTMNQEDENLDTIRMAASLSLPNIGIILFGSRAGNNARSYSDYDLLIVVKDTMETTAKMRYKQLLRKILAKSGIMSDIFIESEEEIKIKSQLPGHIIKIAINEGIRI
ncbi:MAG: hypothetical protein COS14_10710 [Bacteroidetes bacterium CG02_land_8_20_14_3_00_31_25]|nr:MAG: hypothetical protein COS14_10710 [Bacteroidetes bacterium CG02_land_8_20_14_3_00_31_25]PIX36524.1 MAG: hypothetical protein COZ59_00645 [Bacteroidetes bacterium CG_4_8_14_3_um_filter_31_14]PIY03175.1 MAG: hypothetical protein COZ21_10335 [Bacteroidetes bacterium CG_4_10_14_3_um_filter_31_20]